MSQQRQAPRAHGESIRDFRRSLLKDGIGWEITEGHFSEKFGYHHDLHEILGNGKLNPDKEHLVEKK